MKTASEVPPEAALRRRFDEPIEFDRLTRKPGLGMIVKMLPLIVRLAYARRKEIKKGLQPVFDMLGGLPVQPVHGVPLGGLGGGTIGRGWRGDFNRWQLRPGLYRYGRVTADGFSMWVRRPDQAPQAIALFPEKPDDNQLKDWNWGLDRATATYYALFPRAWTVYEGSIPGIRLTCRQVSPVIPHNYTDSSTPAGVFAWTIENTGSEAAEVALMFTFQNGDGSENDLKGGHSNHLSRQPVPGGEIVAIELKHRHRQPKPLEPGQKLKEPQLFQDPLAFGIGVLVADQVDASYITRFITNSDGLDVWGDFAEDGRLVNRENPMLSGPGFTIGAALAARVQVPAGEQRRVTFALAWDMPLARFSLGTAWHRRYTRFYGRDGQAVNRILCDALLNYPQWEAQIEAWQRPILEDRELPDWYKCALFNEAYYLVDGGTLWTDGKEGQLPEQEDDLPEGESGHFAYLEGHGYRMYNTCDVHFYASFALASLWPQLELSIQRDFAHALRLEDLALRTCLATGKKAPCKVRGAIPHDLGSPQDAWRKVNHYSLQDTSRWKDLNAKFVLQVFRDWALTKDRRFLTDVWESVKEAISFLGQFDRDGDGMIENEGFPDQTYDLWPAEGPSAYTGGLWLACLMAARTLAVEMGEAELARQYGASLAQAQEAYERLWNGAYYNYDSSRRRHHDSIMAGQLAGQWYARACGLGAILPPDHTRSALHKIFEFNVMKYGDGELGAVNGMRPDGRVDRSCLQAQEAWTGTTYALAATMLQEGLTEEAFTTAKGMYELVYRDLGLWFQTPEALDAEGTVRASAYMRPLAIWAMQWAWERRKRLDTDIMDNTG